MATTYEWDVETISDGETEDYEDEEVLDHLHVDTYREALRVSREVPPEQGCRYRIVLVRDDDVKRGWAEVVNGELDEKFTDADGREYARVPVRFFQEVARAA